MGWITTDHTPVSSDFQWLGHVRHPLSSRSWRPPCDHEHDHEVGDDEQQRDRADDREDQPGDREPRPQRRDAVGHVSACPGSTAPGRRASDVPHRVRFRAGRPRSGDPEPGARRRRDGIARGRSSPGQPRGGGVDHAPRRRAAAPVRIGRAVRPRRGVRSAVPYGSAARAAPHCRTGPPTPGPYGSYRSDEGPYGLPPLRVHPCSLQSVVSRCSAGVVRSPPRRPRA